MSNLFNLAISGLNSAQAGLTTTGHNVSNAATPGFTRQQVLLSTSGGQGTAAGYFGRGVQVDTVRRMYDSFLTGQLNTSKTTGAALDAYESQITQINNLFGDKTVGIAPAIQTFFASINAVASAPADPAARQEMIGRSTNLATQLNSANAFLGNLREGVNTQLATTVQQINSYVERISDLNQQITNATASIQGQPPNDLLDQRDQLVSELNQIVKVNVSEQGNQINLSVGNGQTLLAGTRSYALHTVQSAADPTRVSVAYTLPDSTVVELADNQIDGGSLGGLLQFRSESLDKVQNDLGRMAAGLAIAFNAQHAQGLTANGSPGADDFFAITAPPAIENAKNTGTGAISSTFTDANQLTGGDYKISFDGTNYQVTRMADGSAVATTANPGPPPSLDTAEGFSLQTSGTPVAGDSWIFQPTRNVARDIAVTVTNPGDIAAADATGGSANGSNALKLAQLQTAKTLGGGTMSVNEAFSQLVNQVGVQTQRVQVAAKAQDTLVSQNLAAQQGVSGVNLNEEYISLERYLEQYRASARLIEVGTTLFDTLLGLRG